MRVRFFSVPAREPNVVEEDLNRLLAAHRVLTIDRHLVADGAASFWAVCVTYLDGGHGAPLGRRGKVDYREVLTGEQFALYVRLRTLRKEIADSEGVPAYALFTNEQLAALVLRGARTAEDLAAIEGVGPARIEKYGADFLAVLQGAGTTPAAKAESPGA